MIRLIQFLNEKNHFLEKFFSLNESEITRLQAGGFDQLETFYHQREDLLKIIKYIDNEIHRSHQLHKDVSGQYTEEQKAQIRDMLRTKEAYVKRILEQDLVILGLIDSAKSQIIQELQGVKKARKALGGYKITAA
ncbi:hypothetical protein [Pseudobdellovibrio exovorus]|uniref:Flagellar protein FlgN n=1 Tax=Pseudobdellovibrio exovorus JSS TaxID=1184267 RepID=M4VE27_9BACT|nr:hypothetical protein [Pseudobdellovibrio exovorus]AGH96296.1 hypothetical protein A11Q_2080 [Pseudobdellovibrio exovorus JSS]